MIHTSPCLHLLVKHSKSEYFHFCYCPLQCCYLFASFFITSLLIFDEIFSWLPLVLCVWFPLALWAYLKLSLPSKSNIWIYKQFLVFFLALLKYIWSIMCKFKVYSILIWYTWILQSDYHTRIITSHSYSFFGGRTFNIYSEQLINI